VSLKPKSKSKDLTTVRQFQSEIASIREELDPISARITINVLGAALLLAGILMYVVRLDRVVVSQYGKMVTTEPAVVFQPLDTSIIKSINVKEGQRVEKGQLLATLDPTFVAATVTQLKSQIDSLKTEIARDQAEISGQPLVFPPNSDPDFGKYEKVQKSLYDQQMNQYNAELNSFDQKVALAQVTIQKYRVDEARYKDEGDVDKQIEDMYATLQQHGSGSLLNLLTATNTKLEAIRQLEFDRNSVLESEHSLASSKADREAFIQQFLSTASQDLVTSRNSLDTAEAQLESASKHQDLVRLEAPEASIVQTLAKVSVGSVLTQGTTFMTLTPIRVPIEAEIWIATRDIGFMRPGDSATLKIDAFNYQEHGAVEGKVRWIGEDTFTTDENGNAVPAYYKARVTITGVNLIDVPATFRLMPGMTLQGDVLVGTRSMWDYFVGEVGRGLGTSMREP
jgi:hemolysin D